MAETPAGWYPEGPGQLRYWDGAQWTENVAPDPASATPADPVYSGGATSVYVNQVQQSNPLGTTGFVFSLVAILVSWVPVVGWIVWALGLIFSLVGVFRQPRGLAIAGLVISLIGVFFLLVLATVIFGFLGIAAVI